MWKSNSLLSAVIAALLLLGLPIFAGDRLPAAFAQVNVSFKEWLVPTKGSHPHDPLAAADGSLWYTGQMASTLGRLDPETGAFKEYRTNIPNSGPHGLVADEGGNIWFTASFAGYIGKLDPRTGAITEYRLPADAHDPHTPVFDQHGNLWFTIMGANAIGRLVPQTGEIKNRAHADQERTALWDRGEFRRNSLFRRVRHQQACEHQPGDDGHQRISVARRS